MRLVVTHDPIGKVGRPDPVKADDGALAPGDVRDPAPTPRGAPSVLSTALLWPGLSGWLRSNPNRVRRLDRGTMVDPGRPPPSRPVRRRLSNSIHAAIRVTRDVDETRAGMTWADGPWRF